MIRMSRISERSRAHSARRAASARAYARAKNGWAHHAANATLQLHLR